MRLIFIRHAEPDYEHDSLTEKGWREAKLLAVRTKSWQVDDFYVSPLGRAQDTASFTLLEQGKTPAQVSRILGDTYYVSPSRRRLAVETAQEGLRAKADLRPEDISLYIGIPFCPTRCAYCSFISADVKGCLKLVEPFLESGACTSG